MLYDMMSCVCHINLLISFTVRTLHTFSVFVPSSRSTEYSFRSTEYRNVSTVSNPVIESNNFLFYFSAFTFTG